MNSAPAWPQRFAAWIQSCGVAFLGTGMVLAWGGALAVFAGSAPSASAWVAVGFLAYAVVAGIGIVVLRRIHRQWGSSRFLWVLMGASLAIQLGIAFSSDPNWIGPVDAGLFRQYLDRLATSGYSPEVLSTMSGQYDYPLWTHRALPFHLAIRMVSGAHFVRAIQTFQALLLTASLFFTWRIARILFGRQTAFWAATFQFLMPYHWIACLDLNHHVTGVFYFAASLWILAEWFRPSGSAARSFGLAVAMGALVPLLRLGGGMDRIYAVSLAATLVLLRLGGQIGTGRTIRSAIGLLVWPLLVSALLVSPLSRRIEEANLHRLSSGMAGFMARGWMPETGGEYSATYEQIDVMTPLPDKQSTQIQILVSQACYNLRTLLFRLFPTKMAKFFLLGYASSAEEMLSINGSVRAAAAAKGARTAYLLGVLPLMAWGAVLLLPRLRKMRRIHIVLPCVVYAGGIVLMGETSPRYSIYILPFLLMLAALPLAWAPRRRRFVRASRRPLVLAALSLGVAFALASVLLAALRPWLRQRAFADLRAWTSLGPAPVSVPPTLAPMEFHLNPRSEKDVWTWGPVQLPPAPDRAGILRFYVLAPDQPLLRGQRIALTTEYAAPDRTHVQTNLVPGRIDIPYRPGKPGTIQWKTDHPVPFPLRVGYAFFEPETP